MKRLLYVCQADFGKKSDGVVKKIKAQICAFIKMGFSTNCLAYENETISFSDCSDLDNMTFSTIDVSSIIRRFAFWKAVRQTIKNEDYDVVYVRYSFIDFSVLKSFRLIKKKGMKLIVEIPSIYTSISLKSGIIAIQYIIDKLLSIRCKKYIDKLLYIGDDPIEIWGMQAIPIPNGIPYGFDVMKKTGLNYNGKDIVLLAVSTMGVSRGYDRLVYGLKNYYENGGTDNIILKFVGEGEIIPSLKRLVMDYNLAKHVIFYPQMSGEELDSVFESATLGVGALGLYRLGNNIASTLKVKEYLVRGLPFIYAGKEIGVQDDYKYSISFPNDDTPIDFTKVCNFIKSFELVSKEQIIEEMNEYVKQSFSWDKIFNLIDI